MQPLIPPEQADQYRKLQEQAQKHAKKQLKRQQQREKGEPESSSSESEEEPETQQEAEPVDTAESEQAEMERAAFEAGQGMGEDSQTTVLVPTAQSPLLQQHHTMLISPQPVASPMSLAGTPHLLHAGQPGQPILVPAHHATQVRLLLTLSFLFVFVFQEGMYKMKKNVKKKLPLLVQTILLSYSIDR